MRECSLQEIMDASDPRQIFTMNPATLQEEYEHYLEQYRPDKKFQELKGFIATQNINLLFQKAQKMLDESRVELSEDGSCIILCPEDGKEIQFVFNYHINQGVCDTYANDSQILMIVDSNFEEQKGFFSNYCAKVRAFKLRYASSMPGWDSFRHSVPKIVKHFKTIDGLHYALILEKPCKIYPLRQILDYFDGRMDIKHVVSIVRRLYYYVNWLSVMGLVHNGICIDNIYFSPGRELEDLKQECSVEDLRIVGIYGGWFFTTYKDEMVKGFPRTIKEIIPKQVMLSRRSTSEVDILSIMKVARELLGDVTGKNLFKVHSRLCDWFNRESCSNNALVDYEMFEKLCKDIFGEPKFYGMDLFK